MSLAAPYGDTGFVGVSSVIGITSGEPYTAAVDEMMILSTPASRAALEQVVSAHHVDAVVEVGFQNRFRHDRGSGKVQDGIGFGAGQHVLDKRTITQIASDDGCAVCDRSWAASAHIVEHDDLMTSIEQFLDAYAPNISRTACHENEHRPSVSVPQ